MSLYVLCNLEDNCDICDYTRFFYDCLVTVNEMAQEGDALENAYTMN